MTRLLFGYTPYPGTMPTECGKYMPILQWPDEETQDSVVECGKYMLDMCRSPEWMLQDRRAIRPGDVLEHGGVRYVFEDGSAENARITGHISIGHDMVLVPQRENEKKRRCENVG